MIKFVNSYSRPEMLLSIDTSERKIPIMTKIWWKVKKLFCFGFLLCLSALLPTYELNLLGGILIGLLMVD